MPPTFPSFLSGIYALAFWFAGQLVGKRENTFEEVLKVRTALTVAALDIGAIPSLLMAVFVIFSSGSFQHQAGRLLFPGQAAPARFCSPSEHLVTCPSCFPSPPGVLLNFSGSHGHGAGTAVLPRHVLGAVLGLLLLRAVSPSEVDHARASRHA